MNRDRAATSGRVYTRRFVWTRWCALGLVVWMVGMAGLWWTWAALAERRLERAFDELRRFDVPLTAEAFTGPPVADELNAVVLLRSLAPVQRMNATGLEEENLHRDPFMEGAADLRQAYMAANERVLRLVREARGRPEAQWDFPDNWEQAFGEVGPVRETALVLHAAALEAHQRGDDPTAVAYLLDMAAMIRALEERPLLVSRLVVIGLQALLCDTVELIAPELQPPAAPEARAEIDRLIEHLLDTEASRLRAMRVAGSEAIFSARSAGAGFRDLRAGMDDLPMHRRLLEQLQSPTHLIAGILMLDGTARLLQMLDEDQWPPLADEPASQSASGLFGLDYLMTPVWQASLPAFPVYDHELRVVANRRAAALRLAIRLYQFENDGALPPTLQALAPSFIPAVPADPFAQDGRPFGYMPDAPRPLLYSVGHNGQADLAEGRWQPEDWDRLNERRYASPSRLQEDRPDAIFLLHRPPPRPPLPPLPEWDDADDWDPDWLEDG